MKSSTDLFQLIQSLSPSEKGYFKKYAAQSEGKKYLKLFDAINAMEEYDEEKLKKKFKRELSNLSAAKNHLFEEILDAVRAFHLNNSFTSQIYRLTDQADVLLNRGLTDAARDKYAEAYEKAVAAFCYDLAIVPRMGYIHCCYSNRLDLLHPVNDLISLNNKILNEAGLLFGHTEFVVMKTQHWRQNGSPQTKKMLDEAKAAEDAHLQSVNEKTKDSVYGRALYHQRETFCARESNNRMQTLKHSLGAVQIFIDYPQLKTAKPGVYLEALGNLLVGYTVMRMGEEKLLLRKYIKQETDRLSNYLSPKRKIQTEYRLYYSAIVEYMRIRSAQEADTLFSEVLRWLEKNKKKLQVQEVGLLYLWFMEQLFRKGEYRELLFRCNEFLYDKSMAYPQFQRACALLIYLMVYLEQGDWDMLPAKLKEAYRLLKEENSNNEAVMLVVRLVGKVIKEKKQFELKPTLQKLKQEMVERRIKKETGISEVFSPFHFEAWLDSKLEGIHHMESFTRYMDLKEKKLTAELDAEFLNENLAREDFRLPFMMKDAVGTSY